jgi:hypothetical protein
MLENRTTKPIRRCLQGLCRPSLVRREAGLWNGCYGRRMLHHVVTFDLKPDAPADQVDQIAAALEALASTLPEVRSLAVGADLRLREGNAGFGVAATFDDVDGFRVYADHPEHVRVIKELIGPHITGRHPVQFTA